MRPTRWTTLLLAMLAGHIALVIAPISHMQYRYVIFPVIVAGFFAARFLTTLWSATAARRAVAVTLVLVGGGWMAVRAVDLTVQTLTDTRVHAGRWFDEHASPGDQVAYFGAVSQLPGLPVGVTAVRLDEEDAEQAVVDGTARFIVAIADWSSRPGSSVSRFFPPDILSGLENGSYGFVRVFEAQPLRLLGVRVPYLAFVNPPVVVYERRAGG